MFSSKNVLVNLKHGYPYGYKLSKSVRCKTLKTYYGYKLYLTQFNSYWTVQEKNDGKPTEINLKKTEIIAGSSWLVNMWLFNDNTFFYSSSFHVNWPEVVAYHQSFPISFHKKVDGRGFLPLYVLKLSFM